jgi:antitoxin MazE
MKTRVVKIGNRYGIRIPLRLLQQANIGDEVVVAVENESLVIRPVRDPRAGWAESFDEMARRGDDALILGDPGPLTEWEQTEWEWPNTHRR